MSIFEPLPKTSVAASVMDQIQRAMEEGRLKRGDRLPPEPELAESFQVSRASIREVLKVLEVLGIVETRRGSGTYIADKVKLPSLDPLIFLILLQDGTPADFAEFRYMIETGFTRLAQKKLQAHHIAQLEKAIAELEEAIAAGTVTPEHDLNFHRIILEATDNPFVILVGTTMLKLFRTSIGKGVQTFPSSAVEQHKLILEALKSGEPERVDAAVETSYQLWQDLLGVIFRGTHRLPAALRGD